MADSKKDNLIKDEQKKDKFKSKNKTKYQNKYTVCNALKHGNIFTRLSCIIMGLGNITCGQIVKGIIYMLSEAGFIWFMVSEGLQCLGMLPGLGENEQGEIWNETLGVYEYVSGDNSLLILLYGVATCFVCAAFIMLWRSNIKSAYEQQIKKESGKHIKTFTEDIKSLFDDNLHKLLLTLPVTGVLAFTILPLVFMISMAFTNYSKVDSHLILFDWVGLENFKQMFDISGTLGKTFWSVLGWTIIWAIFATALNYILGMLLAMLINRKGTKIKGFWRFVFILSIAVPQFVSLLVLRSMLTQDGIVNVMLRNAGIIDKALPFFTNATWARVTVIVVNLWIGIPYTMMQVTGILQNIPMELYEAADVDGANGFVKFFKITLPYMLFVTAPYLITTFTANINNFNIIYLLTKGDPVPSGSTAGKTDLLVTWLYKLTVDYQYYNLGAVIGIMTFILLAIGSLLVYRRTKAYKDEEGFQ